jgi:hypothetical protein
MRTCGAGRAFRPRSGSPGRIRTADISLAGRAQGAFFVGAEKVVAPGGFEPPISASPGARRAHFSLEAEKVVAQAGRYSNRLDELELMAEAVTLRQVGAPNPRPG